MTADEVIPRLVMLGLEQWADAVVLDADAVDMLLSRPAHEGLTCLLGAAVEGGQVVVPPEERGRIMREWAAAMSRAVHLDGVLTEAWAALAEAGIPARVLKGVAIATIDEPEPTWRSYGDLDLLVPPDRLMDAAEVLGRSLGAAPLIPPVRRWWADRFAKGLTLEHPSGVQIDVHRLLAAGPLGARVRMERLFEPGDVFRVGALEIEALGVAHRLLHAAYHAALGSTRGERHRRDLLLLAAVVAPDALDRHWTDGWSRAVVVAALSWAAEQGRGALPGPWQEWCSRSPGSTDETAVADAAWLADVGGGFRQQARGVLTIRRPVRSALFAAGLAWPCRAHLRARGLTRRVALRRLTRRV